jgi:predicted RNase H-like nuclease (RuvC/YqgF family)
MSHIKNSGPEMEDYILKDFQDSYRLIAKQKEELKEKDKAIKEKDKALEEKDKIIEALKSRLEKH